jgi:hypothetical protein
LIQKALEFPPLLGFGCNRHQVCQGQLTGWLVKVVSRTLVPSCDLLEP